MSVGLVSPSGKPISAGDGPTGRKIIIHEALVGGRSAWGVEFTDIGILEALQILGDVIRGMCERERSLIATARNNAKVQAKMDAIKKEDNNVR